MWHRIASWRGHNVAQPVGAVAGPPDGDALALVGVTLRSSYRQEDDNLDDRLVALMIELSLDPPDETGDEAGRRWR